VLEIVPGGFKLNANKKITRFLLGRSSFKLSNLVMQGPDGKFKARQWIDWNQGLFGENVVLRVFLETAGWTDEDGMFGSAPTDQGFWNLDRLRDGKREKQMHPLGRRTLEWFFKTSEKTGVAFELVIDATLKHNNIPKGEIDHVIRQTALEMGRLSLEYPRSLVIPNCRNEWNAHNQSKHTLGEVNMWAARWARDKYWPGSRPVVCPGGGDTFTYSVGEEAYNFGMGLIHPSRNPRDREWWELPDINALKRKAKGMPVGFNESMYLVEREDADRAQEWYRGPDGWTINFNRYMQFLESAKSELHYFVIHDEKGVQCDINWPTPETRIEREFLVGPTNPPPPPPPTDEEPPEEPDEKSWLVKILSWFKGLFS